MDAEIVKAYKLLIDETEAEELVRIMRAVIKHGEENDPHPFGDMTRAYELVDVLESQLEQ